MRVNTMIYRDLSILWCLINILFIFSQLYESRFPGKKTFFLNLICMGGLIILNMVLVLKMGVIWMGKYFILTCTIPSFFLFLLYVKRSERAFLFHVLSCRYYGLLDHGSYQSDFLCLRGKLPADVPSAHIHVSSAGIFRSALCKKDLSSDSAVRKKGLGRLCLRIRSVLSFFCPYVGMAHKNNGTPSGAAFLYTASAHHSYRIFNHFRPAVLSVQVGYQAAE